MRLTLWGTATYGGLSKFAAGYRSRPTCACRLVSNEKCWAYYVHENETPKNTDRSRSRPSDAVERPLPAMASRNPPERAVMPSCAEAGFTVGAEHIDQRVVDTCDAEFVAHTPPPVLHRGA